MSQDPGAAPRRFDRRQFLAAGSGAALATLGGCQSVPVVDPGPAEPASHRPPTGYLFGLGVASGEPLPDSVVLWTRLAPDPLNGGGMPPAPVAVGWEVAEDAAMQRVVARGCAEARAEWAHAVHVEAKGLRPARWYWYRFHAQGQASPVGRTRTAPAPSAAPQRLGFAVASCQDFQNGYYGAYRHMARESIDFVLHLGDYIYEYPARPDRVRRHRGGETVTLADYRNRYAQYRADPDLQAAHAALPWLAVWDDHEVENDYADDRSEKRTAPADFLRRRAAAYRAYFEHMPLPPGMAPTGPRLPLYRRRAFGDLVDLFLLDGRQYRSDQACPGPRFGGQVVNPDKCAELADPRRTLLGAEQERWLFQGIAQRRGRWTVIGQQLLMASLIQTTREGEPGIWTDGWDGYPVARRRLADHLADAKVPNPVVLGGDIHSYWVSEVKRDYRDPRSPPVASEFVATSISSSGVPQSVVDAGLKLPHVKFAEARWRGYIRCTVTPRLWRSDLQTVDTIARPDARLATLRSFAIEAGRAGPQVA
jgi:alkaline phosphatase D